MADPAAVKLLLRNTRPTPLLLHVDRTESQPAPGQATYFCRGDTRYPAGVASAPAPGLLAAGGIDSTFVSWLVARDEDGGRRANAVATGLTDSWVRYCFAPANAPNDTTCVTISYRTENVSAAPQPAKYTFAEAYPNPAQEQVAFGYPGARAARLEICDLLGRQMSSHALPARAALRVDVSRWPRGVYVYHLAQEGRTLVIK